MNDDIDNRLRAHFADRAEHEALPAAPGDVPVLRASRPRWQQPSWLAGAAAVLVLAGVAAGLALADEEGGDDVDVVGTDGSTTTTTATGTSTTERSAATSTTTIAPTPNTDPGAMATRSVVVALDGVLGWWDGSRWVRSDSGEPVPAVGGERFVVMQVGQPTRTAVGSAPYTSCGVASGRTVSAIDLGLEFPQDIGPRPVAVSGLADPEPRPTIALDPSSLTYRQVASDVLASIGVDDADPPIAQLLRTDLEGDGVDEVLMALERMTYPGMLHGEEGDYSVLVLRRVVDGSPINDVLHSFVARRSEDSGPYLFTEFARVAAVADLNGDGRMEVAVNEDYYEETSTLIYESTADGVSEVLSVRCGL